MSRTVIISMNPSVVIIAGGVPLPLQFTLNGIPSQVIPPNAATGQTYTCTFADVPEADYTLTIQAIDANNNPVGPATSGPVSVTAVTPPPPANVAVDLAGAFTYQLV